MRDTTVGYVLAAAGAGVVVAAAFAVGPEFGVMALLCALGLLVVVLLARMATLLTRASRSAGSQLREYASRWGALPLPSPQVHLRPGRSAGVPESSMFSRTAEDWVGVQVWNAHGGALLARRDEMRHWAAGRGLSSTDLARSAFTGDDALSVLDSYEGPWEVRNVVHGPGATVVCDYMRYRYTPGPHVQPGMLFVAASPAAVSCWVTVKKSRKVDYTGRDAATVRPILERVLDGALPLGFPATVVLSGGRVVLVADRWLSPAEIDGALVLLDALVAALKAMAD